MWNSNGNGNWTDNTKWNPNSTHPNGPDEVASLTNNISAARTITLDASQTIGTLNIGDPTSSYAAFLVSGSNTLVFDVTAGSAAINKTVTANTAADNISVPIQLNDDLTVTVNATSSNGRVILSGPISDSGGAKSITMLGAGRLELTGASTFSGGVIVTEGTVTVNAASALPGFTSGPLGTGSLTLNGGRFITSSGGTNEVANAITLNAVAGNTITNSSTTTNNYSLLSGDITGPGGFEKSGGSGNLILSGANNYTGQTRVSGGTLLLAKTQSFYNGVDANWTDANFSVDLGATLAYAVGGAGEFSLTQFLQQATVGTGIAGFQDGSSIGIDTTNGGDQTISTVFANNNFGNNRLGVAKLGAGTLFLTAANTHSGPTTALGGTLNLSNLLAVQNSTLTTTTTGSVVFDQAAGGTNFMAGGLAGNGDLILQDTLGNPIALTIGNNGTDSTYSGSLSGAPGASLTKIGAGTQTLSAANSYDGGTTVDAGTLVLTTANSISGGVTVNAGNLVVNNAGALGGGTLTLNTGAAIDNTTGANITVNTSNDQVWNGDFSFLGTRALNLGTGPITMTDNIEIALPGANATNNALTIGGAISGVGFSLTKSGPGRMFLTGQSTFSGGVIMSGGPVHVLDQSSNFGGGTGPLGTGTVSIVGGQLIGSSINAGPTTTLENNIDLTGGSDVNTITTNATLILSGVISGSGGFVRGGNGIIILTNANTFMGDTDSGDPGAGRVLNLSNELALQNSTLITSAAGASIEFDGSVASNAFTLGGLSGDRDLTLNDTFFAPTTLTIGNNGSDTTHTGILSGDGGIVKVGSGKSTLGGNNTYFGTTTINSGTLLVNGTHFGGGAYLVNSGGSLGGTGVIQSSVTVASGGAVAPGASIESLDVDSLTLESGSLLNFELGAPGVSDLINVVFNDGFTANGGTFNFANAGGMASGTYTLIDYSGTLGGAFGNMALGGTQPAGFTYMLVDNAGNTSIDLQVMSTSLPGDFNLDGKVNAADYVLWRKHPGSYGGPGGYDTWRANFGNPPGAGSGAGLDGGAAPEPASLGLLLTIAVSALGIRRRRAGRLNS